ncbi:MAG TPA: hypothetical protein VGF13_19495, partial [Verrucomicrobiae bacterium]
GESEGKSFHEIIEASYTFGWRSFDQSCLEAYESGLITEETAVVYCSKRGPVQRGIDNIKKKRGENTTEFVLRMAEKLESRNKAAAAPQAMKIR